MNNADRTVLNALHRNARNWMTAAEWQQVEAAVEKAGGVLKVQGWERTVLEKAAKQSFGGDRSAAGRYAAQQRWARRGGTDATAGKGGAASSSAASGDATWEQFDKVGLEAKASIPSQGLPSPMRQLVDSAVDKGRAAKLLDVSGKPRDAWEKASVGAFDAEKAANMRGAPKPVKRLAEIMANLVLKLTDAYYAAQAA